MRQIWITKAGPPEVLQVREAPDPVPAAGEIRVRVRAAGINFADIMARLGLYRDAPPIPCVVGYEVAGVIDQVGEGVTGLEAGQRVFAMPKFGGYTDTLVLPARQAFPMPEQMPFEEAAAMPVVYLTAHHALHYTGTLHEGAHLLVHSAAGGVGIAVVQLAQARGCVIYGTASPSKHEFLRSIGVQHPLDSGKPVGPQVRAAAGGRGMDLALDAVGGASLKESYRLLGPGGRLVCYGVSSIAGGKTRSLLRSMTELARFPFFHALQLMSDNKTVTGINMASLFERLDILAPQFEALLQLYEAGVIKPRVDKTFRFEEASAAHHYIQDRRSIGKVVLVP